MLQLLAGSLDSGASMLHAMEIVAQEGNPPLADEFARVVVETQVGRPMLDSLQAMADRCASQDLDWTVEAIRIQYTSGGSLSETLRTLAEFMRAYELLPNYRVLYNIGQVQLERHDYVAALHAFDDYLEQGARDVHPREGRLDCSGHHIGARTPATAIRRVVEIRRIR